MDKKNIEKCPKLDTCEEEMSYGAYEGFCCTPSWIECHLVEDEARKRNLIRKVKDWIKEEE